MAEHDTGGVVEPDPDEAQAGRVGRGLGEVDEQAVDDGRLGEVRAVDDHGHELVPRADDDAARHGGDRVLAARPAVRLVVAAVDRDAVVEGHGLREVARGEGDVLLLRRREVEGEVDALAGGGHRAALGAVDAVGGDEDELGGDAVDAVAVAVDEVVVGLVGVAADVAVVAHEVAGRGGAADDGVLGAGIAVVAGGEPRAGVGLDGVGRERVGRERVGRERVGDGGVALDDVAPERVGGGRIGALGARVAAAGHEARDGSDRGDVGELSSEHGGASRRGEPRFRRRARAGSWVDR
ncbi:MAG: hypothetical protein H6745_21700 [Deltaproteobacteria bacterium]|nr:hypothetical protein [Deltaproteobacteria bacterium]